MRTSSLTSSVVAGRVRVEGSYVYSAMDSARPQDESLTPSTTSHDPTPPDRELRPVPPLRIIVSSSRQTHPSVTDKVNWALGREYVTPTPFRRGTQALIKFERENNRRVRRVTPDEETRLLEASNSLVHMLTSRRSTRACGAASC